MALIEATNITQQFDGGEILKALNLKIDQGEVFTLIGPTGSGKTTLLRILDLLEKPSAGRLLFDGIDVTNRDSERLKMRRRMAYVQQRPIVFSSSVYDNVACGLMWRHTRTGIIKRKTEEALHLVGMADFQRRKAKTLSGGETQRVAIARAIVTQPEVLFLDEPTANMDPTSTARIEEALAQIISERKTTVIMTTHNMSQGQRMASRLGVLIKGELLQTGSVNEIFIQPRCREVAEFVGIENSLDGIIKQKDNEISQITVNGMNIVGISKLAAGEEVNVLIRPEVITFSLSSESGSARNVFKGTITKINLVGALVRIEVFCGFLLLGVITAQAAQELNISPGKEIYASFKATAIHVIKKSRVC